MWPIERVAKIDFETYSEAGFVWDETGQTWRSPPGASKKGISAVGALAYAEHASTEVLTMSYKLPGWNAPRRWRPGLPAPIELFEWIAAGGLVEAHNAMFERAIWHFVCRQPLVAHPQQSTPVASMRGESIHVHSRCSARRPQ